MKQQQLQSIHSISTIQNPTYLDLIVKLDRILRMYRMIKNNNTTQQIDIRKKSQNILKNLQKLDINTYKQHQQKILKFINQSLAQPVQKSNINSNININFNSNSNSNVNVNSNSNLNKSQSSISSIAANGNNNNNNTDNTISPFGSSKNIKSGSQKQSDNNSILFKSSHSINNKIQQNNLNSKITKNKQTKTQQREKESQKNVPNSTIQLGFDYIRKQQSGDMSISEKSKLSTNLKQFCQIHSSNIQSKLSINEDIITVFKNLSSDKVALLGVQKPHDMKTDLLYLCTLMQFPKQQVTSLKFKSQYYQNQLDQFINVIRYPLALVVIGQTISDMKVHYVKFLLQMSSPLPIVIIYNQVAPDKSLVIRMNQKTILLIQNTNMIEIQKLDSQINMKDKNKYKCISFKDIIVAKQKCVSTKILSQNTNKKIIQNDQAIMVQKPAKCDIKIQKNQVTEQQNKSSTNTNNNNNNSNIQFEYKVHFKFMTNITPDLFVYLINNQKQLDKRKKIKDLNQAIDYIVHSESLCAFGFTIKNQKKNIPCQYFKTYYKVVNKCAFLMIRLKSLGPNKVAFVTLKQGITQEQLEKTNYLFKDFQVNQTPQFNILFVGGIKDTPKYQTQTQLQQI